jgi:predicted AAA+ superfamily ATPase
VDFVLENRRQSLVGIEVKAAATVLGKDFNGLRHLRETVPAQFKRGVVLYTGEQVVHFDEQLTAVPITLLL